MLRLVCGGGELAARVSSEDRRSARDIEGMEGREGGEGSDEGEMGM